MDHPGTMYTHGTLGDPAFADISTTQAKLVSPNPLQQHGWRGSRDKNGVSLNPELYWQGNAARPSSRERKAAPSGPSQENSIEKADQPIGFTHPSSAQEGMQGRPDCFRLPNLPDRLSTDAGNPLKGYAFRRRISGKPSVGGGDRCPERLYQETLIGLLSQPLVQSHLLGKTAARG